MFRLKAKWNQLQSNRKKGQIVLVISLFLVIMCITVMVYLVYLVSIMHTGRLVEDSLVASELAGALVDIERLGKTGEIWIDDTDRCFYLFKNSLYGNLQLNENGISQREELSYGPVTILDFRIYNVSGEQVIENIYDEQGNKAGENHGMKGEIVTPNQIEVSQATIYAKVGFYVGGINHTVIYGEKEKTVDITKSNDN